MLCVMYMLHSKAAKSDMRDPCLFGFTDQHLFFFSLDKAFP